MFDEDDAEDREEVVISDDLHDGVEYEDNDELARLDVGRFDEFLYQEGMFSLSVLACTRA